MKSSTFSKEDFQLAVVEALERHIASPTSESVLTDMTKQVIKDKVLATLKMLKEHEAHHQTSYHHLIEACLRQDQMFRAWHILFDESLKELTKEEKIVENIVKIKLDGRETLVETFKLPEKK